MKSKPIKPDYEKAYNILMDYWEYIDKELQPEIDRKLKRLGL